MNYTGERSVYADKGEWFYEWDRLPEVKDVFRLDEDRKIAMQKLAAIESAVSTLPGLDCGACGAPSCMAFAEDIASGEATMDECVRRDK